MEPEERYEDLLRGVWLRSSISKLENGGCLRDSANKDDLFRNLVAFCDIVDTSAISLIFLMDEHILPAYMDSVLECIHTFLLDEEWEGDDFFDFIKGDTLVSIALNAIFASDLYKAETKGLEDDCN